jgi:transposase
MANFRTMDRDQTFLLPPSLRDWLAEDHLAWFVIDAVAQFDLGRFVARYRPDGRGGSSYDPAMMVTLLLYAYCVGERSSRRIEVRCRDDVAFRVITANQAPDHATIARFRAQHGQALQAVFVDVLRLCARLGLVRVGMVALDSTKVMADGARGRDRSASALAHEVAQILAEAEAADRADDDQFGADRGDELPRELGDRDRRLARLQAARAALGAMDRPRRGGEATVNLTDPDSRIMHDGGRWVRAYNVHAVVDENQIVIAAEATNVAADSPALAPLVAQAQDHLRIVAVAPLATVVADAGYWSTANVTADHGCEVLMNIPRPLPPPVGPPLVAYEAAGPTRGQACADYAAGRATATEAALRCGLSTGAFYRMMRRYRRDGLAAVTALPRPVPWPAPAPPGVTAKRAMAATLDDPQRAAQLRRRNVIVEPVFGQLKHDRGLRRLTRHGLEAARTEWRLWTSTHNLLKAWRASLA